MSGNLAVTVQCLCENAILQKYVAKMQNAILQKYVAKMQAKHTLQNQAFVYPTAAGTEVKVFTTLVVNSFWIVLIF